MNHSKKKNKKANREGKKKRTMNANSRMVILNAH